MHLPHSAWLTVFLSLSGCASIMSHTRYTVSLESRPNACMVTVENLDSGEVQTLTTPSQLTLKAKSGYASPAGYRLIFKKEGYYPEVRSLHARLDAWYVGNFAPGLSIVGMLIVDPLTGAMWRLDKKVCVDLTPQNNSAP